MIYSLALVFSEELHEEIKQFAYEFQILNDCEFEYNDKSIPHTSLIKYESKSNPFVSNVGDQPEVILSGLTLLPSRSNEDSAGTWVEISVLLPLQFRNELEDSYQHLELTKVRSEVGDLLRPHITICKLKFQDNIKVGKLEAGLFRKNGVKARLLVGVATEDGFEFNLLK